MSDNVLAVVAELDDDSGDIKCVIEYNNNKQSKEFVIHKNFYYKC